ncbi:unnamed protein product [Meloidogyne enterolobii]|uniref:Uncharacterized protein n=1 Tax=Meloidogyne enterolobii TaxID=390850 RepID=A0ACB0XU47_MELEN
MSLPLLYSPLRPFPTLSFSRSSQSCPKDVTGCSSNVSSSKPPQGPKTFWPSSAFYPMSFPILL